MTTPQEAYEVLQRLDRERKPRPCVRCPREKAALYDNGYCPRHLAVVMTERPDDPAHEPQDRDPYDMPYGFGWRDR